MHIIVTFKHHNKFHQLTERKGTQVNSMREILQTNCIRIAIDGLTCNPINMNNVKPNSSIHGICRIGYEKRSIVQKTFI